MARFNEIRLIGFLGADPQLRYSNAGDPCCNFSIATADPCARNTPKEKRTVTWHQCEAWGKLGDWLALHLKKGEKVFVLGRIKTHESTKEGMKYKTAQVKVESCEIILKHDVTGDAVKHVSEVQAIEEEWGDDQVPF